MRLITILFLVCIISSCSTSNISKNYSMDQSSGKGLVIGSITYDGGYSGYNIVYRQLPTGVSGSFQSGQSNVIVPYFPEGEFESIGIDGNLIAAELPAGDYEINSWGVGSGFAMVKPTVPFSITFHVSPGKAVYIGNFHFTQLAKMGLTVTGAKVDYREMRARDIKVFAENYTALSSLPVESALESGKEVKELGGKYHTNITIYTPVPVK